MSGCCLLSLEVKIIFDRESCRFFLMSSPKGAAQVKGFLAVSSLDRAIYKIFFFSLNFPFDLDA